MNNFLGHILTRHLGTEPMVVPRLTGRFESEGPAPAAIEPMYSTPDPLLQPGSAGTQSEIPQPAQSLQDQPPPLYPTDPGYRAAPWPQPFPGQQAARGTAMQAPNPAQAANFAASEQPLSSLYKLQPEPFPDDAGALTGRQAADAGAPVRTEQPAAARRSEPESSNSLFEPAAGRQEPLQPAFADPLPGPAGSLDVAGIPLAMPLHEPRPVIRVSIGQIHVRAAAPASAAAPRPAAQPARKPSLSLDEYLKKRG